LLSVLSLRDHSPMPAYLVILCLDRTHLLTPHLQWSDCDNNGDNHVGSFVPGCYTFLTGLPLTGMVVLDKQGDPDAAFHFKVRFVLWRTEGSAPLFSRLSHFCVVRYSRTNRSNIMLLTQFTLHAGPDLPLLRLHRG
jgi:hypothetical protein